MPVFHLDYKLVNFDVWLALYKISELRKKVEFKHGVKTLRVLHDALDRNHAIVVLEAGDRASIDQLIGEPEVKARFSDRSTFVEPPKITGGYEGTNLEPFEEGENPAFQLDHSLQDYNRWFEAWSSNQIQRTESWNKHGCKPIRILRDIDNDNHVIIVVMASNQETVKYLLAEPRAQEIFADREVFKQPPQIIGQYTSILIKSLGF